ncbi:MAG: HAD family phosphatase [Oscillospiraceae bacterium]|nr:HAD family phosphatase [Oscillospiraceae bacterium]
MIKNYVFDLGQVLAAFDPAALTAACVDDPETAELIRQTVFDRLYWDKLDAGTMTDEEARTGFCSRLPEHLHETACRVYDTWVEHMAPIDGMQELARDIKKQGGMLYLLSNTSVCFAENYGRSPWLADLLTLFDGMVISGVVKLVKPDKKIFAHLLSQYELKAEETVFIDDNAKNIAACQALGIGGYLFDGDAQKLRSRLGLAQHT